MIDRMRVNAYCIEDISLIENYKEAVEDKSETWVCHHKLELHEDYLNTAEDLDMMNLYYHRPACELIFLKRSEHVKLHNSNIVRANIIKNTFVKAGKAYKHTEEDRKKISAALKGKKRGPFTEEHRMKLSKARSGRKFPRSK